MKNLLFIAWTIFQSGCGDWMTKVLFTPLCPDQLWGPYSFLFNE